MYSFIRGVVDEIGADRAVVEAAGVGYELYCSSATLKTLAAGQEAKIYVHFHLAQDVVALYGFYDALERAMFRKLISVTRVGPKLALAVLSVLSVSDVTGAILTDNAAAFDRVPGMGKKTAARVLLELKEKVIASAGEPGVTGKAAAPQLDMRTEAVAALVSLGYDGVTAGRAVAACGDCERIEDLITQALKSLAGKGIG